MPHASDRTETLEKVENKGLKFILVFLKGADFFLRSREVLTRYKSGYKV